MIDAALHVARRLFENVRADRHHPPLAALAAQEDPERFVWGILPYAARSFSFSIAVLPRPLARTLAVAYCYCRMLDTCEDLAPGVLAKETALAAFVDRFANVAHDGAAPLSAPPALDGAVAHDARDEVYLLLLRRAALVDAFFHTLSISQREVVVRLVSRMGEGMIWAVRTFAAQGGALRDEEQLARYCFAVLGQPMVFAEEAQRSAMGLPIDLPPDRVALAAAVGESVQLANVARDLEKDTALGIHYLPETARASAAERPAAIVQARRRLLRLGLTRGVAFAPFMAGIPSPRRSLARAGALLMAQFTLAFWQGTAKRLALPIVTADEEVTPTRCIGPLVRSVFSRAGFAATLARLEVRFAASARRLAELDGTPRE